MARFAVQHSDDACCIEIRGDVRRPEPSTVVIRFPGGHVEVARHSDGSYWVHVACNARVRDPDDVLGKIVESRIDYTHDARRPIEAMPAADAIEHMAIRIAKARPDAGPVERGEPVEATC